MHRIKLGEDGLGRKLAERWLAEIILGSPVPVSLELLEQLTVLSQKPPIVSKSVAFKKHAVFVQKTVATVLDDRVELEEAKIGSLYIYTHAEDAFKGMVKIGQTYNPVETRLANWSDCGHGKPILLRTCDWICHPQRVELLTHFELMDHRREQWCKVHKRAHVEWFQVDVKTARWITKHWSAWMQLDPYNQGHLGPFWKVAIRFLIKYWIPIKGKTLLQIQKIKRDIKFLIIHRKGTRKVAVKEIEQLAGGCRSLKELFRKCMGFYKRCNNGIPAQNASDKREAETRLRSMSRFCKQNCRRRKMVASTINH